MRPINSKNATARCEDALQKVRQENVELDIFPSEIEIVDRLLARAAELAEAYVELDSKLGSRPFALEIFFGLVVSSAAFWGPDEVEKARSGRARLERVNALVAQKAAELSTLLKEREHLHNHSGFAGSTHYHVAKVIDEAADQNALFRLYIRETLRGLRTEFGLKYWPDLSEVMGVLARDARNAELEATDSITEAATSGPRGSRADFFKALYKAIEENSEGGCVAIPQGFRPSDATIASLANCALGLGPDDLVDSAYVKRLRQRRRAQGSDGATSER